MITDIKNICRITDSFPPPWTGVSPGIFELSVAQSKTGISVHVITKHATMHKDKDKRIAFRVYRIRAKLILFEILAIVKLIMLHRKHNFDLIHSHGSSFFLFHLLRKIFRRYGVFSLPVAVSVHNIREYQDEIYRKSDFFSLSEQILGRRLKELRYKKERMLKKHSWQKIKQRISYIDADLLLPVSNTLGQVLKELYGIDENIIRPVGNGVSPAILESRLKNGKESRLQFDPVILFIGRTIGTKNESSLLKAFLIVKAKVPRSKLIIIGNGYWHFTLIQIAKRLGIKSDILFLKHVEHSEIANFYNRAHVFAFPSFSEGMPKVILEAMACGLPVVSSDVDGNNELIKNGLNGLLLKSNEPEELAHKILKIINSPSNSEKYGLASQQLVQQEYTWERIAEKVGAAYQLIQNKSI